MINKKISVVTVCYNAKEDLIKTLNCTLNQDFADFECVVVDGNSTDGSVELLKNYKKIFKKNRVGFKYISEDDDGIYDAMNKGVKNCSGELVVFMNAGDVFFGNSVLKNVASAFEKNTDIIYGNNISVYKNIKREAKSSSKINFKFGMPFCHQSAYIRRRLLLLHPYKTEYKICADYEFFVSMHLENRSFKYIDENLSIFEENGISSKNTLQTFKETLYISYNSGLMNRKEYQLRRLKILLASFIPAKILNKRRRTKKSIWNKLRNI